MGVLECAQALVCLFRSIFLTMLLSQRQPQQHAHTHTKHALREPTHMRNSTFSVDSVYELIFVTYAHMCRDETRYSHTSYESTQWSDAAVAIDSTNHISFFLSVSLKLRTMRTQPITRDQALIQWPTKKTKSIWINLAWIRPPLSQHRKTPLTRAVKCSSWTRVTTEPPASLRSQAFLPVRFSSHSIRIFFVEHAFIELSVRCCFRAQRVSFTATFLRTHTPTIFWF